MFFGPAGYTNGIACSSTHPLERPPLFCLPFEFATVQVYGFWAFACFSYCGAIQIASLARPPQICSRRRSNSGAVQMCNFRALFFFALPAYTNGIAFSSTLPLASPMLICSKCRWNSTAAQIWKLWGVRLFLGPPGYTKGIACSSTHPLERPPLICSPFEFATVQVYGFWAFACFSY